MKSAVTEIEAAAATEALAHFEARRRFETDCWDVHASIVAGNQDFVLLDVRSPTLFQQSHIPGAINLPHGKIIARNLSDWPMETLFVVYCAGPHCNGANKAAVRLAGLGRPVKELIGGMTGWADEGFEYNFG
jgi:rhodanese-related sulfurtransferase